MREAKDRAVAAIRPIVVQEMVEQREEPYLATSVLSDVHDTASHKIRVSKESEEGGKAESSSSTAVIGRIPHLLPFAM